MLFEFDTAKSSLNIARHGVPLLLAAELDWHDALAWVDDRFDYGEVRLTALVPKALTLYCVSFVDRNDVRRIISLRKATRREAEHYVEYI